MVSEGFYNSAQQASTKRVIFTAGVEASLQYGFPQDT